MNAMRRCMSLRLAMLFDVLGRLTFSSLSLLFVWYELA